MRFSGSQRKDVKQWRDEFLRLQPRAGSFCPSQVDLALCGRSWRDASEAPDVRWPCGSAF